MKGCVTVLVQEVCVSVSVCLTTGERGRCVSVLGMCVSLRVCAAVLVWEVCECKGVCECIGVGGVCECIRV